MKRRSVLGYIGLVTGGTLIGGSSLLYSCSVKDDNGVLSREQMRLLAEIAETILPKTEGSPGAKEANIVGYINNIVSDFYTYPEQQMLFREIISFDSIDFISLSNRRKSEYILKIEQGLKVDPTVTLTDEEGETTVMEHPYLKIKNLVIRGYLNSEIIAKNVFDYVPQTVHYRGCVDVTNGRRPMYHT